MELSVTPESDPVCRKRKLYFFDGSHRMQAVIEHKPAENGERGYKLITELPQVRVTSFNPLDVQHVITMRSLLVPGHPPTLSLLTYRLTD